MEAILEIVKGFVEAQGGNYAWISTILMVIGVMRVLFKPIMSLLIAFVGLTPSVSDESWLAKVMDSKIYKGFAFFLDWSSSIKLPQKPAPVAAVAAEAKPNA